jgi:hypothetical protein
MRSTAHDLENAARLTYAACILHVCATPAKWRPRNVRLALVNTDVYKSYQSISHISPLPSRGHLPVKKRKEVNTMDIDSEHEASASYLVCPGDKSRELSSQERHPFLPIL